MEGVAMSSRISLLAMGSAVAAILLSGAFVATPAKATPAFAASTGKPCASCHANPAGGGKLTGAGEKFKASKK
jgi:hypothetical protein